MQTVTSQEQKDYEDVLDSYHRCETATGFFETFYHRFFSKSPEIPPRFEDVDIQHQKQVVMASLLWLLRIYRGDEIARVEVNRLAESHSRMGHDVRPELYALWLDALCETVAQCDPEFTPRLESQWRIVLRPGIDMMMSQY